MSNKPTTLSPPSHRMNTPEWIKAMVACSSVSAVCVPLYDSYAADSAAYCSVHSGMELSFVQVRERKLVICVFLVAQARAKLAVLLLQNVCRESGECHGDARTANRRACFLREIRVLAYF